MPLAELLLPEFDEEMAATRRVLERVPDGKASWKPHPKSMTLGGSPRSSRSCRAGW